MSPDASYDIFCFIMIFPSVVPNVDLPPLCSSRFRPGPPGEEAQAASQFIADVIENSQIVLKEDLCIVDGKIAWVLYCDIICLDYDGNLLDASLCAFLAALKNGKESFCIFIFKLTVAGLNRGENRHQYLINSEKNKSRVWESSLGRHEVGLLQAVTFLGSCFVHYYGVIGLFVKF
nr:exosome complex component RRP45B-like [Pogona vitticeps]